MNTHPVLEQAQQAYQQQQQQLQQRQLAEKTEQQQQQGRLIKSLQDLLEQHLTQELRDFLQLGYKIHTPQRGEEFAIAVITLHDEYDRTCTGYILRHLEPRAGEGAYFYQVILPKLEGSHREIYSDLSGGVNHSAKQDQLNITMLQLIGEWNTKVEKRKAELEQEAKVREQNQLQEERRRLQQQQEREQQQREREAKEATSLLIESLLDPIIEELSSVAWGNAEVVCYEWKWSLGTVFTDEGTPYLETQSCWSLSDEFDEQGYITPVVGRPIKLSPNCIYTVEETVLRSVEDCRKYGLLVIRPDLIIQGISENWGDRHLPRLWQWGGEHVYSWTHATVPTRWVRDLIKCPGITTYINLAQPTQPETQPEHLDP